MTPNLCPRLCAGGFDSATCRAAAWKHVVAEREARVTALIPVVAKVVGVTPEDLA